MKTPDKTTWTHLKVDLGRWPLVLLTYSGLPSDPELEGHLLEIETRVLARRQPFVHLIDQSLGEMPTPTQRALIAQHQARCIEEYRRYCLGEAYLVPPQMRGAMTAVFWRVPPPYPYAFLQTRAEALRWCEERMASKKGE
ncbi:MAG: hypothetical protein SF066_20535 [Thermoanaerobaculia bacterium]|nr:hypothetical protein [Thermoanaerobaculia bacterium]